MAKAPKKKAGKGTRKPRAKKVGTGGNGRDLHLADNGGNEEAVRSGFLQHRSRWIGAMAKLKVAEKDLKDVVADAKADGYHKKMFVIADMLTASPKKEAKVVGEVKDRLQVARWIGHAMGKRVDPNQLDMFGDAPTPAGDPVDAAYEAGEQAGLAGVTMEVPGQYSAQDLSQAWLSGWHKGQDTLKKGIKPLDKPADAPAAGWGASQPTNG